MSRMIGLVMEALSKKVPIPRRGVDYRGKVVLAPMVRSGELPSRLLALKYGADLVWGPETIDKSMIGTTRRFNPDTSTVDFTRLASTHAGSHVSLSRENLIYRLHPEKEGRKLIFQIGTASPDTAVEAARLVARDVAGIDVNAGCPKPFSTSGGMGAALLRTPDRLASILEALVKDVGSPYEIGISVKIRLLETQELTAALVRKLVATGITGLTVHCRTTPMRPRQPAIREQLRMIGEICREAGVACLMNGDVTSREEALDLAAHYGVDGAMIATAAEANPSVFGSGNGNGSDGGLLPWEEVVVEYLNLALQVENKFGNSKFSLAQLMPGKASESRSCQTARCYVDLINALGLEDLQERAAEVDEKIGRSDDYRAALENAKKESKAAKAAARREAREKAIQQNMDIQLIQKTNLGGSALTA